MRPKFTSKSAKLEAFSDRSGGPDSCWEWKRSRTKQGYGNLFWEGHYVLAHRLMWEEANGPIPTGKMICHTCDNRRCINPRHLFLGDARINAIDMVNKGRATQRGLPGERNGHSKVTEEQVREMRIRHAAGGVTCAALAREYGVSTSAVCQIVNRDVWKHVT